MESYSEFYREGFLNKAGKGIIQAHLHSWRPRYFVLNGLQLKYYKTKPSKEILTENMLGCIEVSEMESVSVMKNEKNAFQITTKSPKPRTYYMSGKSEDEIQGWIKCLAMAKAKYEQEENSGRYDVPSAVNQPSPTKPPRSPNVSERGDSPASPISPASPTSQSSSPGAKPVFSQYSFIEIPGKDTDEQAAADRKTEPDKDKVKDENLYQDPTYDLIDDKAAIKNKKQTPKSKNSEQDATLYDAVSEPVTVKKTTSKNNKSIDENVEQDSDLYDAVAPVVLPKRTTLKSSVSNPLPGATVPPPLPARLPSMTDNPNFIQSLQKDETPQGNPIGSDIPDATKAPIGLYGEVGTPNIPDTTTAPIDLYDEVGSIHDIHITPILENKNPVGLYDEVGDIPPIGTKIENNEANPRSEESQTIDPTHVYAKPIKSPKNSLKNRLVTKRNLSKRKLIPGLMDVGEVSIDVEEDAVGGKERLERGMTKPSGGGDRFAIEELREVLSEHEAEMNNNGGGEVLEDFDVNESESAFEALRRFLERYG